MYRPALVRSYTVKKQDSGIWVAYAVEDGPFSRQPSPKNALYVGSGDEEAVKVYRDEGYHTQLKLFDRETDLGNLEVMLNHFQEEYPEIENPVDVYVLRENGLYQKMGAYSLPLTPSTDSNEETEKRLSIP